jgi:hypothetical protein
MCFVGTIPYLQEALIGLIIVAIAISLLKKERCACKAEIDALKMELTRLNEALKARE